MIASNETNALNQTPDGLENDLEAIPYQSPKRGRKITVQDAKSIAELVSLNLTEVEACAKLDINNQAWKQWKCRAKRGGTFDNVLTRLKANKIHSLLGEVRKAATGSQGIRHDWRAAHALLAITDQRFAQNKDASQDVAKAMLLTADTMGKIAEQMMKERQARSQAVVECPVVEAKAIACGVELEQTK